MWVLLRWAPPRPAVYRVTSGAQTTCILLHQKHRKKDDAVRHRPLGPAGARVAPLRCPILRCWWGKDITVDCWFQDSPGHDLSVFADRSCPGITSWNVRELCLFCPVQTAVCSYRLFLHQSQYLLNIVLTLDLLHKHDVWIMEYAITSQQYLCHSLSDDD